MPKTFKWYVHEDIFDNDIAYIQDCAVDSIGRRLKDSELDTIHSALYEIEVEVNLETGEVTIPKKKEN